MAEIKYVRKKGKGVSSEAQLNVVERILKKGRRNFGSSGASLTHQISNPIYKEAGISASLAAVGLQGEHTTTGILKDWIKDKPSAIIVDSVHIKGAGKEILNEETGTLDGGDTDHILIIGNYVILIDSKNWKGKRKYGVSEKGEVLRNGKPFPGGKVHAKQALYLWRKFLRQHSPFFNSIICITSEKVFIVRDVNWWKQQFKVVNMEELPEFLDKVWAQIDDSSKDMINVNLVSDVVINAIKPYDSIKEQLGSVTKLLDI